MDSLKQSLKIKYGIIPALFCTFCGTLFMEKFTMFSIDNFPSCGNCVDEKVRALD